MPKQNLNQRFCNNPPAPPEDKRHIEYCDAQLPGLYLEVRNTSSIGTFYLRYRSTSKKTAHIKLGTASDINLKDARYKARQLKADIAKGKDPQLEAQQKKTVLTWDKFVIDHYFPHAKQVKRTWKNDEDMHRLRLSKRFGSTAINAITQQNVQQFHNDLRATGMAPATADHHLKFLRHALNLAVEWGLLESNPAAKVKQFNEDNQVERYLSDDELSRLVKVLATYENRPMACLVLWLLSTGARSGEAKAANWEDINLEQRVWIVKSENSKSKRRRSIALNDVAISVLEEIKSMGNTSGALFVGRKGRYRYLNKNWAHLCERADLKDLRMHDLRHNYASMLVNAGHSLYEVQQSLGHSDPKVTMRYSHLSKATLQEAANSASQRIQAAMGV